MKKKKTRKRIKIGYRPPLDAIAVDPKDGKGKISIAFKVPSWCW